VMKLHRCIMRQRLWLGNERDAARRAGAQPSHRQR
jgi:hypothetical protein